MKRLELVIYMGILSWWWKWQSNTGSMCINMFYCLTFTCIAEKVPGFLLLFFSCCFLFLKLSCMSCVYILDSDPLSVISLENVFSNSVGCLFFLMVSFSLQKLLRLIRSHFFNFGFYFLSFRRQIQKQILLWFTSKDVLPMFSSRSLIVSGRTFRCLIHFEFIFVYGIRECSNFIVLHVALQFFQHHLLKRLSFLHCIFLPPLS